MTQTDCAAVQKPQMFMPPKHRTGAVTGVNNDKDIFAEIMFKYLFVATPPYLYKSLENLHKISQYDFAVFKPQNAIMVMTTSFQIILK